MCPLLYTNTKSPLEVLQERYKKLRKSVYEIDENIKNTLPAKNTIDNLDAEIKYCQDLVKAIEKNDVMQLIQRLGKN